MAVDRPSYAVLLGQEDVWVDGSGKRHRLAEMDLRYCLNVWNFLTREAPRIAGGLYIRMASIPAPQGEVASDDYDAITEELLAASTAGPESAAWIRRQPLTRALEERIRELGEALDDTRTITVTLTLKVPQSDGSDEIRRMLARSLRGLPYEHEIVTGADRQEA